ncbi:tetratricopeptide repeat-containing glycosyltransferase family 2 protein [Thermovenabulum sp.]|uniref:tetratricopeptide repeat-containing glycosyltransferase family 2 protein n=1 Tax=Thermovenabulum sp. TaxID=3100335 RepID=UPI003C79C5BC
MQEFTLIFKGDRQGVEDNLKKFFPIINNFENEIIIISKDFTEKKLGIENKEIFIWDEDIPVYNLEKFCRLISKYENFILVDQFIELNDEDIYKLYEVFKKHKEKSGIKFFHKFHIVNGEYFTKSLPFLQGNSDENCSYEENDKLIIDNNFFIKNNDFQSIIYKFLQYGEYEALTKWFKFNINTENINEILCNLEDVKITFFEKNIMEINENIIKYNFFPEDYLIMLLIQNKIITNNKNITDKNLRKWLSKINFDKEKLFLSYLMHFLKRDFSLLIEFLKILPMETLKNYLEFQFRKYKRNAFDIVNFIDINIIQKEIKKTNNKDIKIYYQILKQYISTNINLTCELEERTIIPKLFANFGNTIIYMYNYFTDELAEEEKKLALKIDEASKCYIRGEKERTYEILEDASKLIKELEYFIRLQIIGSRLDAGKHDYKLSICMIVKNEEKNLERCLESIKPLLDSGLAELIVVDTGSEDLTVEIAKKYTKKLYYFPWNNNFSEARNYSISFARGEYIFILDADEEVEKEEVKKIIEYFSSEEYKNYKTISIKVKSFTGNDKENFGIAHQMLFFKNEPVFYYYGKIHNQPYAFPPKKDLDIEILHYGYIMSDEEIKERKFRRTAGLLKREIAEKIDFVYYWYQLSVSYSMHGDLKEAYKISKAMLKIINKDYKEEYLMYLNFAAKTMFDMDYYDECIDFIDSIMNINQENIDLFYFKGFSYYKNKNFKEAVEVLEKFLQLLENFSRLKISKDERMVFYSVNKKDTVLIHLIKMYIELGEKVKIADLIKTCLSNNVVISILNDLFNYLISNNMYEELIDFYYYNINDVSTEEMFIVAFQEKIKNIEEEKQKNEMIKAFIESPYKKSFISLLKINFEKLDFDNWEKIYHINIYPNISDIEYIINLKEALKLILKQPSIRENISDSKILKYFEDYLEILLNLNNAGYSNYLSDKEKELINCIIKGYGELQKNNLRKSFEEIKVAVNKYEEMSKPIYLLLKNIFGDIN